MVDEPVRKLKALLTDRSWRLVHAQVSTFEGIHNDTTLLAWCEPE